MTHNISLSLHWIKLQKNPKRWKIKFFIFCIVCAYLVQKISKCLSLWRHVVTTNYSTKLMFHLNKQGSVRATAGVRPVTLQSFLWLCGRTICYRPKLQPILGIHQGVVVWAGRWWRTRQHHHSTRCWCCSPPSCRLAVNQRQFCRRLFNHV